MRFFILHTPLKESSHLSQAEYECAEKQLETRHRAKSIEKTIMFP